MKNKSILSIGVFAILVIFVFVGASCSSFTSSRKDGGVFISPDQAENWVQMVFIKQEKKKEYNISDFSIHEMVFDPVDRNIVWIGTEANGLYKTTDGGEIWQPTILNQGKYTTISINPDNPTVMYSANGSNIIKSVDSGEDWDIVYTDTTGATISNVAVDNYKTSSILATTSTGRVLKSLDYGNNWYVLYVSKSGKNITQLVINPSDTRTIYIVMQDNGFEKTTDGGETWTEIKKELKPWPDSYFINDFILAPSDPSVIYIATNYGLLTSSDGGTSWKEVRTLVPEKSTSLRNITISPDNDEILYFTVENLIHKSTDGGTSWKTIENFPSARRITELLVNPEDPNYIYAATYNMDQGNSIFSFK